MSSIDGRERVAMKKENVGENVVLTMDGEEWRAFVSGVRNTWDLVASSFKPALAPAPTGIALSAANRNQVSLLDSEDNWQTWANRRINGLIHAVEDLQEKVEGLNNADARKGDALAGLKEKVDWVQEAGASAQREIDRRLRTLEEDEIPKELEKVPELEARFDEAMNDIKSKFQALEAPHEFSPAVGGREPIVVDLSKDPVPGGVVKVKLEDVEDWIKRARDEWESMDEQEGPIYRALDNLLDDWLEHMQTGTPLTRPIIRTREDELAEGTFNEVEMRDVLPESD